MNRTQPTDEDTAIPLKQAGRHFSSNPSPVTVRSWVDDGIKVAADGSRAYLQTFKEGGRRFTSLRFIEQFKRETNTQLV